MPKVDISDLEKHVYDCEFNGRKLTFATPTLGYTVSHRRNGQILYVKLDPPDQRGIIFPALEYHTINIPRKIAKVVVTDELPKRKYLIF